MQLQRTAILRIELILLPFALEILMNTKDQLIAEIEEYMHHIIWAHDCFDAYMSILDCGKEYYDEICLSNTFFTITRYSLISSLLMELSKLFDQREQTGIPKLIDHIKSSVDVLPKTECFVMWEDSKVVDNVGEMLRLAEETLIELQPVIDILRTRRDKYYAHNDKKYFSPDAKLSEELPITQENVEKLLSFASGVCNGALGVIADYHIHSRHLDTDDLQKIVLCAHKWNNREK